MDERYLFCSYTEQWKLERYNACCGFVCYELGQIRVSPEQDVDFVSDTFKKSAVPLEGDIEDNINTILMIMEHTRKFAIREIKPHISDEYFNSVSKANLVNDIANGDCEKILFMNSTEPTTLSAYQTGITSVSLRTLFED